MTKVFELLNRRGPGIVLLGAAAALTACTTESGLSVPQASTASATLPASTEQAQHDEQPGPVNRDVSSARISVAAVGDIMLGTNFPEDRLADDDGAGYLAAATPLLASADIAFGNLEGVLMNGGEPAKKCSNPAACYLFRSPPRYAEHLHAAGFDVMSLANNHARDFDEAGRDATMAALDRVGIRHSGRQGEIASWQQGELRIAMIAFSPTKGSWPLLDIDLAETAVADLATTHDIVLVSFHGGAEGTPGSERLGFGMEYAYGEKRGDVVAFAHRVIDAGADMVLGHGPHVPRAMELYRNRLIAYSLGNFATYYGISVSGPKGFAPVLTAQLDGNGRFIDGQLHAYIQQRPNGPRPDPQQRASKMIRELTTLDFPHTQPLQRPLVILPDGHLQAGKPGAGAGVKNYAH